MNSPPHHENAVAKKTNANQMKHIERPHEMRIGLQEFPDETLKSVPRHKKMETLPQKQRRASCDLAQIDGEERQHRQGLIELHGMARDAVAEIDAPRERCRRAVGIDRK